MSDDHDRDYVVGYGRPPVAKRFSSEHQPRRRGGKRAPKGLAADLLAEWAKDFQAEEAAGAGEELAELLGSAVAADGTDDADQPHGEE